MSDHNHDVMEIRGAAGEHHRHHDIEQDVSQVRGELADLAREVTEIRQDDTVPRMRDRYEQMLRDQGARFDAELAALRQQIEVLTAMLGHRDPAEIREGTAS
ncbi:MAG: hypothetical protein M0030_11430 [Actinomycetota bacterium]|nr:hypothetical protein [Actinomycetota bacterium]